MEATDDLVKTAKELLSKDSKSLASFHVSSHFNTAPKEAKIVIVKRQIKGPIATTIVTMTIDSASIEAEDYLVGYYI